MTDTKVRFAPSPTGFMHIGNARTALFNWLCAKKLGGRFMLRIDDTDLQRSKKEYEDAIRESLVWLGLVWDEEARQTSRLERHNQVRDALLAAGRIYPCYETPEELEFMRRRLLARGLPPIYDRGALKLSAETVSRYQAEGRRPHYRFKLLPGEIIWKDMVRGVCRYEAENLSDPVVIREDGSFLYHLPSVIDDVDFGISHIVRGEDHVTNTAVQIQMFEAVGGRIPVFAHLPLLTGQEGKLSKRLGSLGVRELRAEGIEAMAVCSYLAKLGTSDAIEPYYTLEGLAASLDFNKIGRSQPKFSEDELRHFNVHYVHSLPYTAVQSRIDAEESFWESVKGNLERVDDIRIWQNICRKKIEPLIEDAELTSLAADLLPPEPWDRQTWTQWIEALKQRTDKKGRSLFHPIRLALTACDNGPELQQLLPLIGRERAYNRLKGRAS